MGRGFVGDPREDRYPTWCSGERNPDQGCRKLSALKFNPKAKPSVRVGRKPTDLRIYSLGSLRSFCPVNNFETTGS